MAFGNVGAPEAGFHDQHRPSNGRTTLLRSNDAADVDRLFDDNTGIATVLYEPVLANAACLMPKPGYVEHVQAVARRHGALLIADEVPMGFRLRNGLTSHHFGLEPDLATVGKAVAGGIATSAVVGRPEVLDEFMARKGKAEPQGRMRTDIETIASLAWARVNCRNHRPPGSSPPAQRGCRP